MVIYISASGQINTSVARLFRPSAFLSGLWSLAFQPRTAEKCPASWGHWLGAFPGHGLGDGGSPEKPILYVCEDVDRVCR